MSEGFGKRRLRRHNVTRMNAIMRLCWAMAYAVAFRFSPTPCHGWRRAVLRCFGARIGNGVHVYPSCRIWAPWNLVMGNDSCLGPNVLCYNVACVELASNVVVSQNTHLCSATHDNSSADFDLYIGDIIIEHDTWVAADAFVGPGVTLGSNSTIYARAVVTKDVESWCVVAGNPMNVIRRGG